MKETRKPYTVASYEAGKKAETREENDLRAVQMLTYPNLHGYTFRGFVNGFIHFWYSEGASSDHRPFDLFEKD